MTKQKNILYVTPMWNGAKEFFVEANKEFYGMPAFSNVVKGFYADDRVAKVHFVFYCSNASYEANIHPDYRDKFSAEIISYSGKAGLIMAMLGSFFTVLSAIGKSKADIVFGQGSIGALGILPALVKGLPFFQRIYGTFLINEIHKPTSAMLKKSPLEYFAFRWSSKALIITNDGTHGDRVAQKINPKNNVKFWLNGIDKAAVSEQNSVVKHEKYISYVARVDEWKRQDVAIRAMGQIKEKYGTGIPLYIIGHFVNPAFLEKLKGLIAEYKLTEVVLVGPVPAKQTADVLKNSYASLAFYHTSNLGNVFLECCNYGTPLVAINCNESLEVVDKGAYVEIQEDQKEVLFEEIYKLWQDESHRNELSVKAKAFADTKLRSIDERVADEVNVVLGC